MKKVTGVLLVMMFMMVVAACGGSDGESSAVKAAEQSAEEFDEIFENCFIMFDLDAQVITNKADLARVEKETTECACPGGGTVTFDDTLFVATVSNCTSSNGSVFDGSVTYDSDTDTLAFDFERFGQCTDVVGDNLPMGDDCSGYVDATCDGELVTCDLIDDGADDCELDCYQ